MAGAALARVKEFGHWISNLAEQADYTDQLRAMTALMWQKIEATGDHSLAGSNYPPLRVAPYGPDG